ncbi:hypothetical protein FNF27_01719 [Cafeteria roenbergensis]|uniref:Sugar phosphate transporter domain-containing protein n=1 Tax=Cafeteria roenbergensis TaxID=33653 RepID=A0A5A8EJS6_CAFRO|nr:hypothetical protein FNF27_01719 [Cafeteria roenbergensis]
MQAALWILLFYTGSLMSNVLSKELVGSGSVSSSTLTLLQLSTAVVADSMLLSAHWWMERTPAKSLHGHASGSEGSEGARATASTGAPSFSAQHPASIWLAPGSTLAGTARTFAPISLLIVAGKLSTFASYAMVSMSLAQTAKALEPVFNVMLAFMLYGERQSALVQATLVPIVAGVALASVSEPSFQALGFAFAMGSGMLKVLQNIYTKRVMDTRTLGFFQIHLWCAAVSLVALLPFLAGKYLWQVGWAVLSPEAVVGSLSHSVDRVLAGPRGLTLWHHAPVIGAPAAAPEVPWGRLLACAGLQYLGSVASYGVLSRVHHLTFTITNTMKRVIIIGGGVLYFANPVTAINVVGMVAAVAGVTLYNLARRWVKPDQRQPAQCKPLGDERGRTSPSGATLEDAQSAAEAGRSAGMLIPSAVEGSTGGSSSYQFPEGRLAARSQASAGAGIRSEKPPRWASPEAAGSTALRIAAHRSAFGARGARAGPESATGRRLRRFRTPSGGAWDGQSSQSELTPVVDGELVRVTSFS